MGSPFHFWHLSPFSQFSSFCYLLFFLSLWPLLPPQREVMMNQSLGRHFSFPLKLYLLHNTTYSQIKSVISDYVNEQTFMYGIGKYKVYIVTFFTVVWGIVVVDFVTLFWPAVWVRIILFITLCFFLSFLCIAASCLSILFSTCFLFSLLFWTGIRVTLIPSFFRLVPFLIGRLLFTVSIGLSLRFFHLFYFILRFRFYLLFLFTLLTTCFMVLFILWFCQ